MHVNSISVETDEYAKVEIARYDFYRKEKIRTSFSAKAKP